MDRLTYQDDSSFHPGEVAINVGFVAGTSGAVPAIAGGWIRRAGVSGCVLSGTGLYTFTLQDSYLSLLDYNVNVLQVTYAAGHAGQGTIAPAGVSVNTNPATIAIQLRATDGTNAAAALTAGDTLQVRLVLSRIAGNG